MSCCLRPLQLQEDQAFFDYIHAHGDDQPEDLVRLVALHMGPMQ
jgi:hypothetical protein